MKANHIELLKTLLNEPSNASNLAQKLDVSLRTIKNYVKEINQEYPNTIVSSIKGYEVNQDIAMFILNDSSTAVPQTSKERVDFIITLLLSRNRDSLTNIYDMSEELFISSSTLKNDLIKVRKKIAQYDLELKQDGDWISVDGLEKNKRKILSSILYEESSVNFVNLESLQDAFPDIDIEFVRTTVLVTFDRYHYFINDYSLVNLILHITIAIDRIKNKSIDDIAHIQDFEIPGHIYEVANDIALELSKKFNIKYNKFEINELALLIVSRTTSLDYNNISTMNIESYIGKDLLEIVNKLIENIDTFFHTNLFDDDFLVRFALHIRSLLIRSKNNKLSRNPLSESLRRTSPLIYESSVNLASELKSLTGISINDDEIAYIAFHIGSAIETVERIKEKTKVVYYCPDYYNIQSRVLEFLKEYFDNDILVTNVITDESQISELTNTDFILTSIPIAALTKIPVVQISFFPNENDRMLLNDIILKTRKQKEAQLFEDYLRELLLEELFEINDSIHNSEDCIKYMSQKLINKGYVSDEFYKDVLEREKLSSTAFSGAAIPHSMYMNALRTTISILISPHGIQWSNTNVNIVIMMSFKKNERYIFNEIFEPITMILTESSNLTSLISTKTYDDFIRTMVDLL